MGGAAGDFGMPTSDEFSNGGVRQQNFEGGNFTYAAGDSAAVEHAAARVPGVIASPASVSAGGRARLALIGFPNNSTLRVSVTGSPDFMVTAANGAYSWEMAIPLAAKSGTIAVHAADTQGSSGGRVADGQGIRRQSNSDREIAGRQSERPARGACCRSAVASRRWRMPSNSPVVGAAVTFTASAGRAAFGGERD